MNGRRPPMAGILYDATETDDEDDLVEVTEPERPAPAIGWAESLPDAAGFKGAETHPGLRQAPAERGPAATGCSTRPATCFYVGKAAS